MPFHAKNYFKNKIFWKKIIKMKGAWNQPFFSLQSKFRLISTLVMYYLNFYIKFDDVIQSVFWLFQKLNQLISANHSWHQKLFHFHLSFWTWNVWKERENIIKSRIFRRENITFLDQIKSIFRILWRAIIWWKRKK